MLITTATFGGSYAGRHPCIVGALSMDRKGVVYLPVFPLLHCSRRGCRTCRAEGRGSRSVPPMASTPSWLDHEAFERPTLAMTVNHRMAVCTDDSQILEHSLHLFVTSAQGVQVVHMGELRSDRSVEIGRAHV